jgi:hypothetical protein
MSLIAFAGSAEQAGYAAILSSAVLTNGQELLETFNAVGLIAMSRALVSPAVVIAAGSRAAQALPTGWPVSEREPPRLGDLQGIPDFDLLRVVVAGAHGRPEDTGFGMEWFDRVAVVAMPEPSAFAAPGDAVLQAAAGTLGYHVAWPGHGGFLTAGHVAKIGSGPLRENRPPMNPVVGNVHLSLDPAGQGASVGADVAVVVTGGSSRAALPFVPAALRPLDVVNLSVRAGQCDQVRAFMQFYYSSTIQGTWGECYMTANGVSIPGDSGAEVRTVAGAPAATVVAGTPGVFDLVQDVGYQIRMTGIPGLILT